MTSTKKRAATKLARQDRLPPTPSSPRPGRPKKDPGEVRSRPIMAKLTEAEGRFFDDLCRKLGGEVEADQSEAIRRAVREAGEKRGLKWPE